MGGLPSHHEFDTGQQDLSKFRRDLSTLPNWAGMSSFLLGDGQVTLMSSEDIRCFFYLFSVPPAWLKYLGFNKLVPSGALPPELRDTECVLVSRVLPMGFLNSVQLPNMFTEEWLDFLDPQETRKFWFNQFLVFAFLKCHEKCLFFQKVAKMFPKQQDVYSFDLERTIWRHKSSNSKAKHVLS